MYGTVAKLKVKKGALDQLKTQIMERKPKGFVDSFVFQSDEDPEVLWVIALFSDKETYFENADSPEQNEEYLELRKLLLADPEWHDGEVIYQYASTQG